MMVLPYLFRVLDVFFSKNFTSQLDIFLLNVLVQVVKVGKYL